MVIAKVLLRGNWISPILSAVAKPAITNTTMFTASCQLHYTSEQIVHSEFLRDIKLKTAAQCCCCPLTGIIDDSTAKVMHENKTMMLCKAGNCKRFSS